MLLQVVNWAPSTEPARIPADGNRIFVHHNSSDVWGWIGVEFEFDEAKSRTNRDKPRLSGWIPCSPRSPREPKMNRDTSLWERSPANIENGHRAISKNMAVALAELFDVSVDKPDGHHQG